MGKKSSGISSIDRKINQARAKQEQAINIYELKIVVQGLALRIEEQTLGNLALMDLFREKVIGDSEEKRTEFEKLVKDRRLQILASAALGKFFNDLWRESEDEKLKEKLNG